MAGASAIEPRPAWQQGPGVSQPALQPARHASDAGRVRSGRPVLRLHDLQHDRASSTPTLWPGERRARAPRRRSGRRRSCSSSSTPPLTAPARSRTASPARSCTTWPRRPSRCPPYHQITCGNNGYYPATGGWSFATGLGSPDVFNLAQDYAAFLRSQSSKQCPVLSSRRRRSWMNRAMTAPRSTPAGDVSRDLRSTGAVTASPVSSSAGAQLGRLRDRARRRPWRHGRRVPGQAAAAVAHGRAEGRLAGVRRRRRVPQPLRARMRDRGLDRAFERDPGLRGRRRSRSSLHRDALCRGDRPARRDRGRGPAESRPRQRRSCPS